MHRFFFSVTEQTAKVASLLYELPEASESGEEVSHANTNVKMKTYEAAMMEIPQRSLGNDKQEKKNPEKNDFINNAI